MLVSQQSKPLENSARIASTTLSVGLVPLPSLSSYLSTVLLEGWILVYLGIEFGKLFQLGGTGDYAQLFTSIISNPVIALGAQAAFILLNIFIVSRGVQKGLKEHLRS